MIGGVLTIGFVCFLGGAIMSASLFGRRYNRAVGRNEQCFKILQTHLENALDKDGQAAKNDIKAAIQYLEVRERE